jgi:Flp pilus assembly protein TadG
MFLPFFLLFGLVIDAAWGLFVKATVQYAAQAGARYAVTGQSVAAIQGVVNTQSWNLVGASAATVTCTSTTDANNVNLTLVQVTAPYSYSPLAPLLGNVTTIDMTATAGQMMEPAAACPQ